MRVFRHLPLFLLLVEGIASGSGDTPADNELGGIGVQLRAAGQVIVVNQIVPDTSAAAQKDLHVGDQIIAIAQDGGPAVPVQNLAQTARAIRGPKGTTVRLTIVSAGEDDSHARVLSFVRGELKSLWGDGVLLPIGTKVPDIEMLELANKTSEHLSDHTNRIVVLEFWASWCGPCQVRMAQLQGYPTKYPDWKTNVVLIAASIDDSADMASKHLKAKRWNETYNVWVDNHAIKAYHINAIPTAYIIDPRGKIVAINPANLPEAVNRELQAPQAAETAEQKKD